jgi:hypothetical protein
VRARRPLRLDALGPSSDRAAIAAALREKSNHVVARAADLAGEQELRELVPELEAAFVRFLERGAERDKTCAAKIAIARALDRMEARAEEVFRAGIRCVQMEPAYGPPVDTAASLRAISAAGLARSRDPEVVLELVELLVDREKIARMGAAQALGVTGVRDAIPVLRLKALAGDPEAEVLGECFTSLLVLDPQPSLDFTARFLAAEEAPVREVAALSLGQSRLPRALEILRAAYSKGQDRELSRVLLLAMAVMRMPAATDALLELVASGRFPGAGEAVAALAVFRDDPVLVDRLTAAVDRAIAAGGSERLRRVLEQELRPTASR